jgi:hypothetical protein
MATRRGSHLKRQGDALTRQQSFSWREVDLQGA